MTTLDSNNSCSYLTFILLCIIAMMFLVILLLFVTDRKTLLLTLLSDLRKQYQSHYEHHHTYFNSSSSSPILMASSSSDRQLRQEADEKFVSQLMTSIERSFCPHCSDPREVLQEYVFAIFVGSQQQVGFNHLQTSSSSTTRLQEETKVWESLLDDMNSKREQDKRQIVQLQERNGIIQQKLGDSAERVKTLEKKLAAGEREAVEWLTNDHAAKMKRKDEIIESLNQKVKELSGGHKYEQQLREYEKKIDSLVERQKAERAVVAEKDSQLATLRQQLSAEQSRRTAKEKQREKALSDQTKELETLKKQLSAAEDTIASMKKKEKEKEEKEKENEVARTKRNENCSASASASASNKSNKSSEVKIVKESDVQVIIDACLCSKEQAMSALKRSNGSIGDACELVIEEMEG